MKMLRKKPHTYLHYLFTKKYWTDIVLSASNQQTKAPKDILVYFQSLKTEYMAFKNKI